MSSRCSARPCELSRPNGLVPVAVAFVTLGAIGVWFNGGASAFFVHAAAYAGSFEPRSRARRRLAGLTGVLVVLILLTPLPLLDRFVAFAACHHVDPARAAREAGEIERLARDALGEVRATVSGWRHHALDVELDAARDALEAAGVTMTVSQDTGVSLSPASRPRSR